MQKPFSVISYLKVTESNSFRFILNTNRFKTSN